MDKYEVKITLMLDPSRDENKRKTFTFIVEANSKWEAEPMASILVPDLYQKLSVWDIRTRKL